MLLAREEYKNKCVVARKENGMYEVMASVNGKIVGSLRTEDLHEAMMTFCETAYNMYK